MKKLSAVEYGRVLVRVLNKISVLRVVYANPLDPFSDDEYANGARSALKETIEIIYDEIKRAAL